MPHMPILTERRTPTVPNMHMKVAYQYSASGNIHVKIVVKYVNGGVCYENGGNLSNHLTYSALSQTLSNIL